MGLFTNGFERAMYKEIFTQPFYGYNTAEPTTLSNLIFDFCASVSHNAVLFPNGIPPRRHKFILHGLFALGILVTTIWGTGGESADVAYTASMGYATTAKQSGAPKELVTDRLALITHFIVTANSKLDQYEEEPEKQELALKCLFLEWYNVNPTANTLNALTDEIEGFVNAYRKLRPLITG